MAGGADTFAPLTLEHLKLSTCFGLLESCVPAPARSYPAAVMLQLLSSTLGYSLTTVIAASDAPLTGRA